MALLRRRLGGFGAYAVGAALAVASYPAASVATDGTRVDVRAIDAFVSRELDKASIPGAAIAVTHGAEVVHVQGFGQDSHGSPVTGKTLFRIASLSKSFTSLAVMQLVDAGRLSLEDTVTSRLPEFDVADPRGQDILVRQLLDQTSGLADRAVPAFSRPQPTTLAQAVASLHSARLVADPGTQWNYHNPNYQVAARLVEVVTGESFASYLRRRVFQPAGMTATMSTRFADQPVDSLADGHVIAFGYALPKSAPHIFVAGDGGVVSNADDLARWLIIQGNRGVSQDGTRVVSRLSTEEMHAASAPGGYALGWETHGPPNAPTKVEHTGTVLTFSAVQAIVPGSDYGIAIMFNSSSPLLLEQTAIFNGVLEILAGRDASPAGARVSTATADTLLALLTLAALGLGIRGLVNSRRWVSRHAGSRSRLVLGLAPQCGVLAFVAGFPKIVGSQMGGRDVTWEMAAYGWFALLVLILTAAASSLATLTARTWHLSRRLCSKWVAADPFDRAAVRPPGHSP